MRRTFHNATVHIRSWIALISVDHDVAGAFFVRRGFGRFFPFVSCDKPTTTFAAQSGFLHFRNHFFWLHCSQNFFQRFIATDFNVIVNTFRVDRTTVLQRHTGLLAQVRIIIFFRCGFLKHFAANNVVVQNVFDHRRFDFLVSHTIFTGNINIYQNIAAAITATPNLAHFTCSFTKCGIGFHFANLLLEFVINFLTSLSNSTQTHADGYFYLALFLSNGLALFFSDFHERSPLCESFYLSLLVRYPAGENHSSQIHKCLI